MESLKLFPELTAGQVEDGEGDGRLFKLYTIPSAGQIRLRRFFSVTCICISKYCRTAALLIGLRIELALLVLTSRQSIPISNHPRLCRASKYQREDHAVGKKYHILCPTLKSCLRPQCFGSKTFNGTPGHFTFAVDVSRGHLELMLGWKNFGAKCPLQKARHSTVPGTLQRKGYERSACLSVATGPGVTVSTTRQASQTCPGSPDLSRACQTMAISR